MNSRLEIHAGYQSSANFVTIPYEVLAKVKIEASETPYIGY